MRLSPAWKAFSGRRLVASVRMYSDASINQSRRTAFDPAYAAQVGTVPYHRSLLVLHVSSPPNTWPSHPPPISPLFRELVLGLRTLGGLVNLSYDPWLEPSAYTFDYDSQQEYPATLYHGGTSVELEHVYQPSAADIIQLVKSLDHNPSLPSYAKWGNNDVKDIYVCTHGTRDCRCGDIGGKVFEALKAHTNPSIRVREIAHVGGHKWAGNVLSYPSGDWYGSFQPEDAQSFLEELEQGGEQRFKWRGKMGLSQQEQRGAVGLEAAD